jgi:lambda family phage portal protein
VPAVDVAHLYNVARIGQVRGLPWLSAAITSLYQINSFLDAELLRKQIVASIVGFVKTPAGDPADPADVRAAYGQVTPPETAGDLPNVTMEPGSMQYLDPGQEVEFNNPADVGGNFEAFLASSYRSVAAASDIIFEELTGDWRATNDRTFRAMFATFKRTVRQWQFNLVAQQFGQPIWTRFIDYAVSSGALKVPKSVDAKDLYRCEWRPERWEYIHPVQDVAATGEAIALGLTSRSAEVAERGDDIEEIDRQIAADHAREETLGLSFGTATPQGAGGAGGAGDSPAGTPAPATPGKTPQVPNSAPSEWQ